MNIGVDVDGVLSDIGRFMKEYGGKYFSEEYGMPVSDPAGYSIEEMFGCTERQRKDFWWKYGYEYIVKQPCYEGCAETLRRFRREGHRIYIITSRTMATGHGLISAFFRAVLLRWLRKNRISYNKIVFCSEENCSEDKRNACKENSIDVMIEDKPENVLAVKDTAKTLCYLAPWNSGLKCDNVTMVRDWHEIGNVIEGLTK